VKKLGIVLAIAVLGIGWIALRRPAPNRAGASKLAPDFSLTDLAGHTLHLSDYRGKVVILDFWATWCEPCKQEIPRFIELQSKYPERLEVIGISMDDDMEPVRAFQQQYKMNYPVALGSPKLADQYGGVLGLPITFVIDREGRIASRHIGATDPSVFEAEVRQLL
jgi:cytochrome c biogenesis protein CcmG, thiol:disulfide interchange protein DsbE